MRSVGLITEYNPFHNGHLHHLQESLRLADADVSVAIMGGHFLQRGEPALVDKWLRAQMALAAGVDVVVELPLPWACSSAPDFARGGVRSLELLGGVDALSFGSELGRLEPLQRCSEYLSAQNPFVAEKTALLLRRGDSYPKARATILASGLGSDVDPEALAAPNNILGIEYLKVLLETQSALKPLTVPRIGAGYHDTETGPHGIASATGIRSKLAAGEPIDGLLPAAVATLLERTLAAGYGFSRGRYFTLLLGQLFRDAESLERYWLVENGVERRLVDSAERAADLEELIAGVKVRQLTRTRVQRLLVSTLLGMDSAEVRDLLAAGPQYLHLLALSERGKRFLAHGRKERVIPLIQNFSRIYAALKRHYGSESAAYRLALRQLALEVRATRMYTLLSDRPPTGRRNRDFYEPLRTN